MHQDTHSFSDLLDIDIGQQLVVELELESHGHVEYRCRINGHLVLDATSVWYFNLLSPLHLHVLVTDVAPDSALEIKRLAVNGLEVLPKYQHLAKPSTAWINCTGAWDMNVPGPFYTWFHGISGQGWVA